MGMSSVFKEQGLGRWEELWDQQEVPQRLRQARVPHLCADQGLEAGLEVVKSAAVESRHLIQKLLVLRLKVIPHRPKLFSGLERSPGGH